MFRDEVFAEDHLVPLAGIAGELWFFNRLDGDIHAGAPDYRRIALPKSGMLYHVPGDVDVFVVEESSSGTTCTRRPLAELEHGDETPVRATVSLPIGHSVVAVVPGPRASRYAVIASPETDVHTLVDVDGGEDRAVTIPHDAVVEAALSDAILVSYDDRYSLHSADGVSHGAGAVVGVQGDRFLLRHDDRLTRSFEIVEPSGTIRLQPPDGWNAIEAVLTEGGFLASCLHAARGYGLWSGGPVHLRDGTLQLFSLGSEGPVIRSCGIATGSIWEHRGTLTRGVAPARQDLRVESSVIQGMPVLHLRSSGDAETLMIALHGGPDSNEWDDLRYGGSYRRLLDDGIDILIVNYPGSRGFGVEFQRCAWVDWRGAADTVGRACSETLGRRHYASIIVFGVSFGAWLAVQVGDNVRASGVIAMSPVFRLESHLVHHATHNVEFSDWARRRFGAEFRSARAGDRVGDSSMVPVVAIIPVGDEVVRSQDARTIAAHRGWSVRDVPGGHYPRTRSDALERWKTLESSLAMLRRAAPSASGKRLLGARESEA